MMLDTENWTVLEKYQRLMILLTKRFGREILEPEEDSSKFNEQMNTTVANREVRWNDVEMEKERKRKEIKKENARFKKKVRIMFSCNGDFSSSYRRHRADWDF